MDSGAVAGIIIAVILVLVLVVVFSNVYIVQQAEAVVIERLGRFNRVLQPGWNFVIPILDQPRRFVWNKTFINESGKVIDSQEALMTIDLRESVFNFSRCVVLTSDGVQVRVNAAMYYRICDAKLAVYEIDDLPTAVQNVAQSQLKEVFGSLTLTAALTSQTAINSHCARHFHPIFRSWGIEVLRIELLDLSPAGASITSMMKSQMSAERKRRAEFILAEGKKAAARLEAEGVKMVKTNLGVAQQEATRKESEGQASARVELAKAEKYALDRVQSIVTEDGSEQSEYLLGQAFNTFLRGVRPSETTLYLPFPSESIRGIVSDLPGAFGRIATASRSKALEAALPAHEAEAPGASADHTDLD